MIGGKGEESERGRVKGKIRRGEVVGVKRGLGERRNRLAMRSVCRGNESKGGVEGSELVVNGSERSGCY
jgi:hypothetical protein